MYVSMYQMACVTVKWRDHMLLTLFAARYARRFENKKIHKHTTLTLHLTSFPPFLLPLQCKGGYIVVGEGVESVHTIDRSGEEDDGRVLIIQNLL